jgi:N-acetylglucosamine-6-phosphate deacetylase
MSMLDPSMPDGVHNWRDGKRILKEGDKLYIEGTDTLAGSYVASFTFSSVYLRLSLFRVVTLDKCIRLFSLFTSTPLSAAIKCATYNPAKCLGIENRKGTLRSGADADLVVVGKEDGRVLNTWVKGKEVWRADST